MRATGLYFFLAEMYAAVDARVPVIHTHDVHDQSTVSAHTSGLSVHTPRHSAGRTNLAQAIYAPRDSLAAGDEQRTPYQVALHASDPDRVPKFCAPSDKPVDPQLSVANPAP